MRRYRDLARDETGRARALLEGLDREDQVHHFQRVMTRADFDAWETRARDHRLIGCIDRGHLVGLAELARDEEHTECSVCVAAGHRGKGIGTALFERACAAAEADGAACLSVIVSRGDAAMIDMAVRHDGFSVFRHGRSMILPEGELHTARWLVFRPGACAPPPASWFRRAARAVRALLGLPEPG